MAVDIDAFLRRTGMDGVKLQEKLGVSSGLLSQYKAGRSNPSYSMLCKLLEEGMTIQEMFGPEILKYCQLQPVSKDRTKELSREECLDIVKKGLEALIKNLDKT